MGLNQAEELEIVDTDFPITKISQIAIIKGLLQGNLGLLAHVRSIGSDKWQSCQWTAPYTYFMPHIIPNKKKYSELNGNLYFCSDADKIAIRTREIIENDQLKDGGFYIPIFTGNDLDIVISSKMFDMGNAIYVVPFLYPYEAKYSSTITLYLVAFNLNAEKAIDCELKIEGNFIGNIFNISDSNLTKLKFLLNPGKFLFTKIPMEILPKIIKREYTLTILGKTKTKQKIPSAAATLALSVGVSILLGGGLIGYSYNKGKGFSVKFRVI